MKCGRILLAAWAALALTVAMPARGEDSPDAPSAQILVLLKMSPEHLRPAVDYGGGYGDRLAQSVRKRIAARVAKRHGLKMVDSWPMPLVGLDCFVMAVPEGKSAEEMAAEVGKDDAVSSVQPMYRFQGLADAAAPNDPMFLAQPAAKAWRLADLHRLVTGRGVTVAVIDSKIERSHPDLKGQVIVSADFVSGHPAFSEEHGTGIAGVIAARAGNGIGIEGVAPEARLMALRACWQTASAATLCNSLSLAKALHFAIERRARIINLSIGGPRDPLLGKLIDAGLSRGISVVAAFDERQAGGGFPASHPGVIAVAQQGMAAAFPGVYTAPGRDVLTTRPGGGWSLANGSSYAAAHVGGLLALLRQDRAFPGGSLRLVAARADGGAIDACATLARAARDCRCTCASAPASGVAAKLRR